MIFVVENLKKYAGACKFAVDGGSATHKHNRHFHFEEVQWKSHCRNTGEQSHNGRHAACHAAELGLPVAAFVFAAVDGKYPIRYFTPSQEIPACGHATLAAGSTLLEQSLGQGHSVEFITIEKIAIATLAEDDLVKMSYPRYEPRPTDLPSGMLDSLGIDGFENVFLCKELETLFIELDSPELLVQLLPDFDKMLASSAQIKEVVITSSSPNKGYDFLLRSFCPWIGINEDPVTGSVHSMLAPYWSQKLQKTKLKAFQASKRTGEIHLEVYPDRITIGGESTPVLTGTFVV